MVKLRELHAWNLSPRQAVAQQRQLAASVRASHGPRKPELIAGVDMAITDDLGIGALVIMTYDDLETVDEIVVQAPLPMPYIPGLLSFREAPVLLEAFAQLKRLPDLIFVDGQGQLHPRGLGLACHLGLWLDCPAIGCAKSPLCGDFEEPPLEKGTSSPVLIDGKEKGRVLRTRTDVRPIYVSVGHKIGLDLAVGHVLAVSPRYRIPEPTRRADKLAGDYKRAHFPK